MYYVVSLSAIGFNVETVTYKNLKFQVWDLGGQTSIRYGTKTRLFCGFGYLLALLDLAAVSQDISSFVIRLEPSILK